MYLEIEKLILKVNLVDKEISNFKNKSQIDIVFEVQ